MQPDGTVETETNIDNGGELENDCDTLSEEANTGSRLGKLEVINRYVFFDFETIQEDIICESKLGPELEHKPNLCAVRVICDDCRSRDFNVICGRCGPSELLFEGPNCLDQFCKFLFNKKMQHSIAIAHNAKGFDAHFIIQYLRDQGIRPKVISRGKNPSYCSIFILKNVITDPI